MSVQEFQRKDILLKQASATKCVLFFNDNFYRPLFIQTNSGSIRSNIVPQLSQISVSIGCLSFEEARFLGSSARDV